MPSNFVRRNFRPGACLVLSSCLLACAQSPPRFSSSPIVWEEPDRDHVETKPKEYFSGMIADATDKNFLRPLARAPYLPQKERAHNVNALDEVPNSSWFQNRIGQFDYTPRQLADAACADAPVLDEETTWEVIAAKPNGAYPGFFVQAGDERYLLKFDSPVQPGRATSADVIGSKIYWAVGYHTPCNRIVYFRPENLKIAPHATSEDRIGRKRPIRKKDIDKVLAKAYTMPDGRVRASASLFLPGTPLGPFRYEGRRRDDPNDHVAHQHRRELRANRLLSAWLHHHDAREQNTLDVWLQDQGPEHADYIRHYMIDWGDCLGSRWAFEPVSRRFGYSYFFDLDQVLVDTVTLGAYPRPWHHLEIHPEAELFGYFNVEDFEPTTWVTEYPNSAFSEMRYDDALWMARILARFSQDHLRAIVATARLENQVFDEYLLDVLIGRRDKILQAYFSRYAPLDRFRLVQLDEGSSEQSLCFEDLALAHGLIDARRVLYKVRFYAGPKLDDELGWTQLSPDPKRPRYTCFKRPLLSARPAYIAPDGAPLQHELRYGVMKIWIHQQATIGPTSAVLLHFYDEGAERGYRLVGIEHPDRPAPPKVY